ncbi:uncharacterized protein A4U43_C01F33740 [Asparagus officinalis]|uniref:2-oxoglutarate-dependent dioxygenase DAO n=1 Tax=Asparagus officinalis TaxID=4686 RepID=A0A5P1FVQ8_ASPOF|nr:2-oxoglutarate-dependent dioxygenase DAO-like [Asparagus officinalis]ONK81873.1 uncharacterized protein A4U43_C01F33740 [Asparagus officinalis]
MVPVIDLLNLPEENGKLLAACEGSGCFRVVNHGVPASLQAEMKAAVGSLFGLSDDVKRRNKDVIFGSGYRGPSPINPLFEAFGIYNAASLDDVGAFCSLLNASPHQREVIKRYASKLHALAVSIASEIAESMGLVGFSFKEWACLLRPNKYSFTKESVGSPGVFTHTDTSFLTLLQEDECVGGLEMMDGPSGAFVAVDPVPGSFLVNIGDVGKAWSNGRLHNVKHRVICNKAVPRLSIAFFLLVPKDGKVEAPAELVDSSHPRLYRSFEYVEYRKLLLSTKSFTGEALSLLADDAPGVTNV